MKLMCYYSNIVVKQRGMIRMTIMTLQNNNFVALRAQFLSYIDAQPKTLETYTRALNQFFKFLSIHSIKEPERHDVICYRDSLKARLKPATVQAYMIAVKTFFKWLQQENFYKNVAENIKGAKIDRNHKKDALTSDQIKMILSSIDKTTPTGKRDYALFAIMITGGLRTIEIARAKIDDLRNLGNSTVLYIQGKGRDEKANYIKLPTAVENAIRAYLQTREDVNPSAGLFTSSSNNSKGKSLTTRSLSKIIKDRLIQAGYDSDRLTAHSLRHTAGTLNLVNGGSLEDTQQLLRHSNINTTMIYLHHIDRAKNQSEQRISDAIF